MKRNFILFALISICAVFLTVTNYLRGQIPEKQMSAPQESNYILIAESNGVNLYFGDVLIKTYEEIVPEVLPPTDRDNLKSGIILKNYDEVLSIIEDFDG